MLERVKGGHNASPLTWRRDNLFAKRDQVFTKTVDLRNRQRDTTSIVGHLPVRGEGEEEGEEEGEGDAKLCTLQGRENCSTVNMYASNVLGQSVS